MATEKIAPPPYIAYQTFRNKLLELAGDGELPPRIDSSVLAKMSGGTQSEFQGALKFFELVDAENQPTAQAKELAVSADHWAPRMKKLIEKYYKDEQITALRTGTPSQLLEAMKQTATPSTVSKAARFLWFAAKDVELGISRHITKAPNIPRRAGGNGRRKKAAPVHIAAATQSSSATEQPSTDPELSTPSPSQSGLRYPYPLREEVTVVISGLPRNLTVAEANRLAAFVRTLAQDFSPGASD